MPLTEVEVSEIANALKRNYVLVGKRTLFAFLGGASAFLVSAGILTYKTTLNAVGGTGAQIALRAIRADSAAVRRIAIEMDTLKQAYDAKRASMHIRGLAAPTKVCLVAVYQEWRDGLAVPNSWTPADCADYADAIVTGASRVGIMLGCASDDGFTLGPETQVPSSRYVVPTSNDCGW